MIRLLLKPIGVAIWLGALLAGVLYMGGSDSLLKTEQELLDMRFRSQPTSQRKFPSSIVLVEMNNDSIYLQQRIPWDQDKIATLIQRLRTAGAKTIVLDLPLLRTVDPVHQTRLKALMKAYKGLHPEPPKSKDDKKSKKRSRRLSRRQKAELALKQAQQKKIESLRSEILKLIQDPSHKRLVEEIKKTKNLVLAYRYYHQEKDILGVDGHYFNTQTKAGKKKKKGKEKTKGTKKKKKRPSIASKLFHLKLVQHVNGSTVQDPALNVFFLRPNPEIVEFAKYQGFTNLQSKKGHVVRRARLVVRQGKKVYPSLALAAYMAFKGKNPTLMIGSKGYVAMDIQESATRTLTSDGHYPIQFYGPRRSIPQSQRILAGDIIQGKNFTKGDLEGKLVFVGISSSAQARTYRTPFVQPFSSLEMHATIAANLMQGETIQRQGKHIWVEVGLLFVLALLLGFFSMKLRYVGGFFVVLGFIAVLHIVNNQVFFPSGDWYQFTFIQLSLILIYFMISIFRRFTEDVQRQETRAHFGSRMHDDAYARVLKDPNVISTEGQWRPVTVLSGSCLPLGEALQEEQAPQNVAKMVSHLLNPMGDSICRNQGMIGHLDAHAFQGFFNAPFDVANPTEQACVAALQMRSESEPFIHQWQLEGLPTPHFSVGIDTGPSVVGNLGGTERFLYSVVGSPVESSSSLQQLNTHYQSHILLSETAAQEVEKTKRFIIRELDRVHIHEEQEPITLYELLGNAPITSPLHEAVEWYQHGLQFYRARNFQEAVRYFQEILRIRPDDGPAHVMLKRSQHYTNYPPSFQWDGAWKLK